MRRRGTGKRLPKQDVDKRIADAVVGVSRPESTANREKKKNYAESLSRELAIAIAELLRPTFPSVLPNADGSGQESPAQTDNGPKKLDVNVSSQLTGLDLGVSVKTLNFRDGKTKRYTKNYSRIDNELRAEATDYHLRQPYSTLVAVVFIPIDACDDAKRNGLSSFAAAVKSFRRRAGRTEATSPAQQMEALFIGLYEPQTGACVFFDVADTPPRARRTRENEHFNAAALVERIVNVHAERNGLHFETIE